MRPSSGRIWAGLPSRVCPTPYTSWQRIPWTLCRTMTPRRHCRSNPGTPGKAGALRVDPQRFWAMTWSPQMRVDLGPWRRADLAQRRQTGSTYTLSVQLGMIAYPSLIRSMGFHGFCGARRLKIGGRWRPRRRRPCPEWDTSRFETLIGVHVYSWPSDPNWQVASQQASLWRLVLQISAVFSTV
jgi:hypothetical protein